MPAWALRLRLDDLEPIVALWHVAGIEALHHGGHVWLRGKEADDTTLRMRACVPCEGVYDVLPDGGLLVPGHRVPHGYLPQGNWQPLEKLWSIVLPPVSLPARSHARVPIHLVPSTEKSEPDVLLTDLENWAAYATNAPQVRLRCCQFAVSGNGRVLIHGTPLPPIPGTRAVARSGLVVPCGWTWEPAIESSLLASAWGLQVGDLWLMWPGRQIERVRAEDLVAANRSAVQQTWEAVHHAHA